MIHWVVFMAIKMELNNVSVQGSGLRVSGLLCHASFAQGNRSHRRRMIRPATADSWPLVQSVYSRLERRTALSAKIRRNPVRMQIRPLRVLEYCMDRLGACRQQAPGFTPVTLHYNRTSVSQTLPQKLIPASPHVYSQSWFFLSQWVEPKKK